MLSDGWLRAECPPGDGPVPDGLTWRELAGAPRGADSCDHWFRRDGALPGGALLEFQGLATQTEVWLDGRRAARHGTMFRPLLLTVPQGGACRLEVCARALRTPQVRPRARWRNRLVPGENLRGVRTSLAGRLPGSGAPLVGPFRPVLLHAGGRREAAVRVTAEADGFRVGVRLAGPEVAGMAGRIQVCGQEARLVRGAGGLEGSAVVGGAAPWWPHTHGTPALHEVTATLDGHAVPLGRVGFRTVRRSPGPGFGLVVNGVRVFCRGALWQGGGLQGLRRMQAAGLNMVRVPGGTEYPPPEFYEAADALGLLVWQDFMFTRFDYPETPEFLDEVRAEAAHVLGAVGRHPSLAVLCGGDEVDQAAAMAGRPAEEWRHGLMHEVLAEAAARACPELPYVPNAPSGGVPPFAATASVGHYFGVGAYQRPLHEAAGVRFAAACLAFSNPPDAEGCRALCLVPGDAAWAASVPRDPGAAWTFEDARDHYAAALFGDDPVVLRRTDPERWLARGRAAVALAMQSALTTWRADPGCGGALVLALQDTQAGPGWGLLDHGGRAKSALHAVAEVSRPVQVLLRDAALDGVVVHLFNDAAVDCTATLRLRGLGVSGDMEALGVIDVHLRPHEAASYPAAGIMGRFVDLAGAWRFGPAPYRVLGAVLAQGERVLSAATLFLDPALPQERLGIAAVGVEGGVRVTTERFAQFVTIDAGAHEPERDHFHLWPGESAFVPLHGPGTASGSVTALNGTEAAHFRAGG